MQLNADECKCQRDRRSLIRVLRRPRIHHMLMNKRAIAMNERVALECIIGILLGRLGTCSPAPLLLNKPIDHRS